MNRDDIKGMAWIIETVRDHMRRLGVPDGDKVDLAQEVLLAAWEKVREGAFQLNEGVALRRAMDAWLYGITWRQWSHYRDRAHWYREVVTPDPLRGAPLTTVEPLGVLEARSALRCLERLEPGAVEALLTAMDDVKGLAQEHNVSERAIYFRRATARRQLAALIEYEREEAATGEEPVRPTSTNDAGRVLTTDLGSSGKRPSRARRQGRRERPRRARPIRNTRAEAFRRLSRPGTRELISRWAVRLGVAAADVADVVQEVLLQAHRSFSSYRPQQASLSRWLNRITVHVVAHHHERAFRRRGRSPLDDVQELHDTRPGAVELLLRLEVQRLIFDCLRALPAEQREVIIAHDFDEIPIKKIAEQRGVSESTIYRLHTGGRHSLKAILLARVCAEEELVRRRGSRGYH